MTAFLGTKVIILTTFNEEEDIAMAFENGADGYILKDIEQDDLINAVKSTANGFNIIQKDVFDNVKKVYQKKEVHFCEQEYSGFSQALK